MKRYEVVLAPGAQAQARKVAGWWLENRPATRDLFDDEMAAVLDRLAEAPKTGLPYRTIVCFGRFVWTGPGFRLKLRLGIEDLCWCFPQTATCTGTSGRRPAEL